MLEVIGILSVLVYLIGIVVFKILIFVEWCLRQADGEDNTKFLIIAILLAWVWPVWITMGFCWANDMDRIL